VNKYSTVVDILKYRACTDPEREVYRFYANAAKYVDSVTYKKLMMQSGALAAVIVAEGLNVNPILLICKSQKNFILSLFAVMLAGAVAIPATVSRRKAVNDRLTLIVDDANPSAAIIDFDSDDRFDFQGKFPKLRSLDIRKFGEADNRSTDLDACAQRKVDGSSVAILQYTSGSTGEPKGVMVTHGNILHNCEAIEQAMELGTQSIGLVALPLFHDMGLIGGVFSTIFSNFSTGFIPPAEFVQYPERWLQIISRERVTVSGGPNFMYEHAASSIQETDIEGISLSSWRTAFSGAEPICRKSIRRFIQRFSRYGFEAGSFYPCYGLAEATLFVTGRQCGSGLGEEVSVNPESVNCGRPRNGTEVVIVDSSTLEVLPEGAIGEIIVSGSSVALGYRNSSGQIGDTFGQVLLGQRNGDCDRYVRTGDLGFKLDGDLYICGREKDVIIFNGRNYFPDDIERVIDGSHPAIRKFSVVAFGIQAQGRERVVVVLEIERGWLKSEAALAELRGQVRSSIGTNFDFGLHDIIFLKPGELPRTSSGKKRRQECRRKYLNRTLTEPVHAR